MLSDRIAKLGYSGLFTSMKYSYKVIETPNSEDISEKTFSEFSENGWELISVVDVSSNGSKLYKIIFKKISEQ